jgi:hypothetical protein
MTGLYVFRVLLFWCFGFQEMFHEPRVCGTLRLGFMFSSGMNSLSLQGSPMTLTAGGGPGAAAVKDPLLRPVSGGVGPPLEWAARELGTSLESDYLTVTFGYCFVGFSNVLFQGLLNMHALLDNPFGHHPAKVGLHTLPSVRSFTWTILYRFNCVSLLQNIVLKSANPTRSFLSAPMWRKSSARPTPWRRARTAPPRRAPSAACSCRCGRKPTKNRPDRRNWNFDEREMDGGQLHGQMMICFLTSA